MKRSFVTCLCALLVCCLCSCQAHPTASPTLGDNLGLEVTNESPANSSGEAEPTLSLTEEPSLSEEEETQISQMDKHQISNTYTYLKDIFSDGVYYLNYTTVVTENRQELKKEIVLASDGTSVHIEEKHAGYCYLVNGNTVAVMDTAKKTYEAFDITGSEFTLDNYVDWTECETYLGKEFTAVSAGTRSRPKLTETFAWDRESISFYYYKNQLNTVSGTDAQGNQWSCSIRSVHNAPKASLFQIPSNYQAKTAASS